MLLRPYQLRDLALINAAPARRILFVATVAYGKSVLIHALAEQEPGRTLVLSNRRQVVGQLADRLGDRATVSTVQAADRRLAAGRLAEPDQILIDEAHKGGGAAQYARILDAFPAARVVGFTGTPTLAILPPSGPFQVVIEGESAAALTAAGMLAPLRYFGVRRQLNLAGVATRGDDYDAASLVAELDRARINGDAVAAYRDHSAGRPCLAFAVSITHAERVQDNFRAAGIASEIMTGGDKPDVRAGKIARLAAGGLLINIDTLTEGFDAPWLHAILDLAPTKSLARHLQRHGRVARAHPGKTAGLVLDCAGNTLRHGTITEARDWLAGDSDPAKKTADGQLFSIRQCQHCLAIHETGPDCCPSCGTTYARERRVSAAVQARLDELAAEEIERARKAAAWARKNEESACRTLADWQALGRRRGHHAGWAFHRFKARASRP